MVVWQDRMGRNQISVLKMAHFSFSFFLCVEGWFFFGGGFFFFFFFAPVILKFLSVTFQNTTVGISLPT